MVSQQSSLSLQSGLGKSSFYQAGTCSSSGWLTLLTRLRLAQLRSQLTAGLRRQRRQRRLSPAAGLGGPLPPPLRGAPQPSASELERRSSGRQPAAQAGRSGRRAFAGGADAARRQRLPAAHLFTPQTREDAPPRRGPNGAISPFVLSSKAGPPAASRFRCPGRRSPPRSGRGGTGLPSPAARLLTPVGLPGGPGRSLRARARKEPKRRSLALETRPAPDPPPAAASPAGRGPRRRPPQWGGPEPRPQPRPCPRAPPPAARPAPPRPALPIGCRPPLVCKRRRRPRCVAAAARRKRRAALPAPRAGRRAAGGGGGRRQATGGGAHRRGWRRGPGRRRSPARSAQRPGEWGARERVQRRAEAARWSGVHICTRVDMYFIHTCA